MATLTEIQAQNPNLVIHALSDAEFAQYGVAYQQYDLSSIEKVMAKVQMPSNDYAGEYVVSNPQIEQDPVIQQIATDVFAGMPISAGECTGQATSFTAAEFHQGSEVNVFQTDVVMVLGKRQQIHDLKFNPSQDAKLFFVPAGTVAEFYSDTLHYSPCEVHPSGFKFIVMVLEGTNDPLPTGFKSDNPLIVKQNKFQMADHSRTDKIAAGEVDGLVGPLVTVKPLTE